MNFLNNSSVFVILGNCKKGTLIIHRYSGKRAAKERKLDGFHIHIGQGGHICVNYIGDIFRRDGLLMCCYSSLIAEDAVVGAAHMRDEDRDYSMFFHLVASPDSEIFSSMTEPISVRGNCSKYIISRPLLAIKSFMRS